MTVSMLGQDVRFEVLCVLEFDSDRKRNSVVTRCGGLRGGEGEEQVRVCGWRRPGIVRAVRTWCAGRGAPRWEACPLPRAFGQAVFTVARIGP